MAARLERKHYERAAVYAARGEWRKCASHVARAVAFGSMEEQAQFETSANAVPFRTWKKASRECVPTETRNGLSRTTCAFRECEKGNCKTDFTRCYLKSEERKRGGVAYTCRGRYGATKKEDPGVQRTRTCTYSLAHGECKLDKSGDYAFENKRVCTYQDGKCETTDNTKAVEFAEEYFNRKGAEQAGIESVGPGPASTRSPRPSPAKDSDAQIAEQERLGALFSAEPEILRGEEPDDTEEERVSAARISSEQDARGAGPQKLPAKRMSREERNIAAFNAQSADEQRPLGLKRSRRKRSE
jgi:hypothetical protein